jgi:hypothetical protein
MGQAHTMSTEIVDERNTTSASSPDTHEILPFPFSPLFSTFPTPHTACHFGSPPLPLTPSQPLSPATSVSSLSMMFRPFARRKLDATWQSKVEAAESSIHVQWVSNRIIQVVESSSISTI